MACKKMFAFLFICFLISNRHWILKIKTVYSTCAAFLPFPSYTKWFPLKSEKKTLVKVSVESKLLRLSQQEWTLGCSWCLTHLSEEIYLLTSSKRQTWKAAQVTLSELTRHHSISCRSCIYSFSYLSLEKLNSMRQEYWPNIHHHDVGNSDAEKYFLQIGKKKKKKKDHFQDKQWEKYFSVSKCSFHLNAVKEVEALKIPAQPLGFSGFPAPSSGGAAKARARPTAQNSSKFWLKPLIWNRNIDLQLVPFKTTVFITSPSFTSSPLCVIAQRGRGKPGVLVAHRRTVQ